MLDKKAKIKAKVSHQTWIILFLIFPMIKCDQKAVEIWIGAQAAVLIKNILVFWNMLSLLIITLMFLNQLRQKGIRFVKIYTWLVFVFILVFTAVTMIRTRDMGLYHIIRQIGNIPAIFMLANIYSDEDYFDFLRGFYYYLTFIMFLAALTVYLLEPAYTNSNGSAYYLFGLDNVAFLYSMNGFFAGMLYHLKKDGKPTLLFLMIYLFIGGAYVYSGTGTGTVIFLICIVFAVIYRKRFLNLLDYRMVLTACTLIFALLVLVQNLSIFSGILSLIGKDVTLSGRTQLWSAAFREFPKHSIFGIGISPSLLGEILVAQGVSWGMGIGHLHNVIVEFLFRGGLVNLTVFILMWLGCYKTVQQAEKNPVRNSILCMCLIQFLAYMFEYRFADISYWILLLSLYHLPCLSENHLPENRKNVNTPDHAESVVLSEKMSE